MHPRTESRHVTSFLLALLCAVGLPALAGAQAISDPNQIEGTIEFTNTNAAILSVLEAFGDDEGFQTVVMSATSIGVTPPLNNSLVLTAAGRTSTTYEITVESDTPGIEYDVTLDMRLEFGRDRYIFEPQMSPPVEPEPAANVVVDFQECAALLDIRWVDQLGMPVTVDGGRILAYRESAPGSGSFQFQAQDFAIPVGSSQEYLAVRGDGSNYEVDIFFDVGTDPFSNKIRLLHEASVQAACDQVVPITCVVAGGGPGSSLGEIIGVVNLLGEHENRIANETLMIADAGPLGNSRLDTVLSDPSEGPFRLENLPPSDTVSPSVDYRVYGTLNIDLNREYKFIRTPFLDGGINGRVPVTAGQVTDLGTTFVLDPGFVIGEIFLTGPTPGPLNSCLADIYRDSDLDTNGDGIPNSISVSGGSYLSAFGINTLATGATKTAFGGLSRAIFEGDFNPAPLVKAFEGDYEVVLGGLLGENTIWSVNRTRLRFIDTATPGVPESYQNSVITLIDNDVPNLEIVPGQTIDIPIRRCFGQLNLSFLSTSTDFFDPRISGSGAFSGPDWESNPADYFVSVGTTRGTPVSQATADDQGLVVACLPEGTYDFTPVVRSVNPGGGISTTELPPVLDVEIECMQIKNVTLGLEVDLDALPGCTTEPTAHLTGTAEGTGDVPVFVTEVSATVNGGPEIPFCTDCGEDPPFDFDVPLAECDNQVTVTAEDEFGNVSSTTASTRFDDAAPVLEGCDDLEVDNDPGSTGAFVDFEVTATDNCDGDRGVVCDPPPGSFFPQGLTEVSCTSVDACGNASSCTFTVSVCQPVDPDVRTQGFWKRQCQGPHPSGEHDNLPAYVDRVNAGATFSDVADVAGLCDRLVPDPKKDKCEQAEAQFMAASLNVASGRVAACNCLSDPDLGATTVGEALALLDDLLSNPGRDFDDCVLAQAVADRINNGTTLVDCAQ